MKQKLPLPEKPDYKDPTLPAIQRAANLLSYMTWEEKVLQLTSSNIMGSIEAIHPFAAGGGYAYFDSGNSTPAQLAEQLYMVLRWSVEESRLGIPIGLFTVCTDGANVADAVTLPSSETLASTWDNDLVLCLMGRL